jgi:undecaprenyl diphosphate synthase
MNKPITPNHVGLIMDGNRRWAKENGKTVNAGHNRGADVFDDVAVDLFDKGVKTVSAFIFSKENWKRKTSEVDFLMRLIIKILKNHLEKYNDRGIRVKVIGSREGLKDFVVKAIETAEERTKNNLRGTLVMCINYTGRQEIADACAKIVEQNIKPEDITEELLSQNMYEPEEIDDVDIIVRTSGEQRLSGFMLWRASYSELMFVDKYWPDFDTKDVDEIINEYSKRQRRFGC